MTYDVPESLRPTGKGVLVMPVGIEMKTASGIVQSGDSLKGFEHAIALKIGPDVKGVQENTIVYYRTNLGQPVRIKDGILFIIDETHIYATDSVDDKKITNTTLDKPHRVDPVKGPVLPSGPTGYGNLN